MVVIPASLRRELGLEEGALVIAEKREGGILFRPAVALPIETYSPQKKAELLLSNAVDQKDYEAAVKAVKEMGIDPKKIPHPEPGA
jgi:bifunctional DNA-binding transcriptional regulator/antitoxin component of YhaV-PrlF toxin-antitoxin module